MSSRRERRRRNPARHDNCPFDKHDSIGVCAALDNLVHYHVLHSGHKFTAWQNKVSLNGGQEHEVEVLIISDPDLLERVRKVVEIPTATSGGDHTLKTRIYFALLGLVVAGIMIWLKLLGELDQFRALLCSATVVLCIYCSLFPASPLGPKKPQRPPGDR